MAESLTSSSADRPIRVKGALLRLSPRPAGGAGATGGAGGAGATEGAGGADAAGGAGGADDAALCAREPIHIPGAIQPHGALLACGPDGRVTHASANLADYFGVTAVAALGQKLERVVGETASQSLAGALAAHGAAGAGTAGAALVLARPGQPKLHLRCFPARAMMGVDIETLPADAEDLTALMGAQRLLAALEAASSPLALCELAVTGLKSITGYDRVMAYRFGAGGHGEVIAESREPALAPYLGLRYPAADVPAQARELFLRQRVGAVSHAAYMPVPVLADPAQDGAAPIDLTYSVLRSVSPVHRTYMRNMGTVASLTVALVSEGALWGMLVCHHGAPRTPGPALRAVAAMTGQTVSLLLGPLTQRDSNRRQAERQAALADFSERLSQGQNFIEALAAPGLPGLVGAGGAAIRAGGTFRLTGVTPGAEAASQALDVLQAAAGGQILATDNLALRHPDLAACVRLGSGALLLPLSPGTDDAILFFRPELRKKVAWGGNPAAHAVRDPLTAALSPRASFAAWEELVSGHAAPWEEVDLAMARRLGVLVADELASRGRRELAALRRDLDGRRRLSISELLDAAPDAMVAVDEAGEIKLANPMAARQFGYRLDALIGSTITSILAEGLQSEAGAAPPAGVVLARTGLRQDGGHFPAEVTLSLMPGAEPPLRLAAIRNISIRKNAERHQQRMETRYRGLLEASPDVMVMINEDEEILLLNRQAIIQFGYAAHQLTGQSVRTIIREGFANAALECPLELTGRRRDGSEFPVEVIIGALGGEAGAGGVLRTAAIRDITARRQAEAVLLQKVEELNRSNLELEQFASIASHDLQEPLRIVAGYTQLLGRRYKGRLDADADKFIEYAVDGASRMQQLIQDMLSYSKVGAKAPPLAPVAAGEALEVALSRLHAAIADTRALVTSDPLPRVLADPRQLAQLFQNLISNALKYRGADPPVVHIGSARGENGKWRFSVRDHGIGIDPVHFERIFGMFQRLHNRQDYAGTGIGLAICKKIVETHGGAIWVESSPGQGADFRFTMPGAGDGT